MFGLFKKRKGKHPTGAELAEEGLKQVAIAIKKGLISLQQGKVFNDIYAHADSPAGVPRLTYVMFSPSVQNQVIARCVILFDRTQGDIPVWQIDWAVLDQYRGKKFGISVAAKALAEFASGMKGKMTKGFFIEAVVDEGNEASKKIARAILGNEEVIFNKATGSNVHSFLRQFDA